MQKSSALQPLTLNNVTKHEELWSSDSDSGITVGSHSPPSKITPDSGIGSEQLSWNLPPPPPSLLVDDDFPPAAMDPRDTIPPAGRTMLSPDEEERQRKQEYVRNTLLEYERQKKLSEERDRDRDRDSPIYVNDSVARSQDYLRTRELNAGGSAFTPSSSSSGSFAPKTPARGTDPHEPPKGAHEVLCSMSNNHHQFKPLKDNVCDVQSDFTQMQQSFTDPRQNSDFTKMSQNYDNPREQFSPFSSHQNPEFNSESYPGETSFSPQSYPGQRSEVRDREESVYLPEEGDIMLSPTGDEGYGTDNRSTTTASLSSPLSSSLSSLTTESSSSLNGSQRGMGGNGGFGSSRAQPVPSGGRLVMAKRGMLVKRRDLPPVERIESVTLEDRLRALTTIEEEDSGSAAGTSGVSGNASGVPGNASGVSGKASGISANQSAPSTPHSSASNSSRRPAGGSAVYEDISRDYEGLYTVINKNKQRLGRPVSGEARLRQQQDGGQTERLRQQTERQTGGQTDRLRQQKDVGQHRGSERFASDRPSGVLRERGGRQSPLCPRERSSGGELSSRQLTAGADASSRRGDGFHRAVPVRLDADGKTHYSVSCDVNTSSGVGSISHVEDMRNTAITAGGENDSCMSGGLGLGGVKVNDSGEIEIDYSYYMKATPSESNDEVNTYSPTLPPGETSSKNVTSPFSERTVNNPFSERTGNYSSGRFSDGGFRQEVRADVHSPRERHIVGRSGSADGADCQSREGLGSERQTRSSNLSAGAGTASDFQDSSRSNPDERSRVALQDFEFSVESDQSFMRVQPRDSGLRQGGVMCSMPNLSLHGPSVSRRHGADNTPYDQSKNGDYDSTRSNTYDSALQRQDSGRRRQDAGMPGRNPEGGSISVQRRNPPPGSGYPSAYRRPGQGERNSCDVGSLYRQADFNTNMSQLPPGGAVADRMSLNLGDLPRIQEQLRATSEMLLNSAPKRHQFASSSDIYKLFQGQQRGGGSGGGPVSGFPQGRNPPYRHSFHTFPSPAPPVQNLSEVKSRLRPGNTTSPTGRSDITMTSQGSGFTSGLPAHGPVRGNHNIPVPDHTVYSNMVYPREGEPSTKPTHVPKRSGSVSSVDSDMSHLSETLAKGQQFITDIVLDETGERLSTLV